MNQNPETFRRILSPTIYERELSIQPLPINNLDVWIGRWPNVPHLRLCWRTRARLELLKHCYETPNIEVGGVLLGHIFRTPQIGDIDGFTFDFIEITGSIRAETLDAGQGHIRFEERTWAKINSIHDRQYADTKVLGWYHTHPGHGVFLSGHDLFIHDNFFNQPLQLALVIDTYLHRGAFFLDSAKQKGPYKSDEFEWDQRLLFSFIGKNLPKEPAITAIENKKDSRNALSIAVDSDIEALEISEEDLGPEHIVHQPSVDRQPQHSNLNLSERYRNPNLRGDWVPTILLIILIFVLIVGLCLGLDYIKTLTPSSLNAYGVVVILRILLQP